MEIGAVSNNRRNNSRSTCYYYNEVSYRLHLIWILTSTTGTMTMDSGLVFGWRSAVCVCFLSSSQLVYTDTVSNVFFLIVEFGIY